MSSFGSDTNLYMVVAASKIGLIQEYSRNHDLNHDFHHDMS